MTAFVVALTVPGAVTYYWSSLGSAIVLEQPVVLVSPTGEQGLLRAGTILCIDEESLPLDKGARVQLPVSLENAGSEERRRQKGITPLLVRR